MANEWISVKDRLPENGGLYLVCCESLIKGGNDTVWMVRFTPKYKGIFLEENKAYWYETDHEFGDIDVTEHITHWMPLPEPPKKEGAADGK